jgi:hypothetical protein
MRTVTLTVVVSLWERVMTSSHAAFWAHVAPLWRALRAQRLMVN